MRQRRPARARLPEATSRNPQAEGRRGAAQRRLQVATEPLKHIRSIHRPPKNLLRFSKDVCPMAACFREAMKATQGGPA